MSLQPHMKMLKCKDIGFDCGFVARGSTDCEVLDATAVHEARRHGIEPSADRCDSWRASIQDVSPSDLWMLA